MQVKQQASSDLAVVDVVERTARGALEDISKKDIPTDSIVVNRIE